MNLSRASRLVPSMLAIAVCLFAEPAWGQPDQTVGLGKNARVMLIGSTFGERLAESGYFDALLHTEFPDSRIITRHAPWSADEVGLRPREHNVPSMLDHVGAFDPDLLVLCFGMAESFNGGEGVAAFERDLEALIGTVRARPDGESRRIVLISPISHGDLGDPGLPDAAFRAKHNADLRAYADVMLATAGRTGAAFVDLLGADRALEGSPLTTNGIHPSDEGCFVYTRAIGRQLGWLEEVESPPADPAVVRALVEGAADRYWHQKLIVHPTNTEYIWGRRREPFGVVNFPAEFEQLERMVSARDERLWSMAKPSPEALFNEYATERGVWPGLPLGLGLAEDAWTPPEIESKGTETSLGDVEIADPDAFIGSFTLASGYEAACFASEQDFEELANPLALTFDDRGRLWVLVAPTYPHLLPGDRPRCKILILEDGDGDGHADTRKIFSDGLYIPTGFALNPETDGSLSVYVGQAPDLLRLRDLDRDDRADVREIVASGFSMPDSHHQLSAFEWDPAGGLMMHEGVFGITGVETPWGVRRARDAVVWRFDPRTQRLEAMSHSSYANPWGHAFDDFGQSMLADASGGANYSLSHVIHAHTYPRKPGKPAQILNRGRPTAGAEIVSSRHFPDEVQGSFLVNQSIGFHGTRWDALDAHGSAWSATPMAEDLISSTDTNFRPVAMEIGPDGALYVVDWCNPLIGHMQYSTRDPRRDRSHGRIWRIKHTTRPLLDPPDVAGAGLEELLDLLRLPERNTRQLVRRRLQQWGSDERSAALNDWLGALDPAFEPLHDRLLLEALWVRQASGRADLELLDRVATLADPRARAGAIRTLRHWIVEGRAEQARAEQTLKRAIRDGDPRVRLEAISAAGYLSPETGERVASLASDYPLDRASRTVLRETLIHLTEGRETSSPLIRRLRLEQMNAESILKEPVDDLVASVVLTRGDLSLEVRQRVATEAGGDDGAQRASFLLRILGEERRADGVTALAELLLLMASPEIRAALDGFEQEPSPEARPLIEALRIKHRLEIPQGEFDAERRVGALAILAPGEAGADAVDELRGAVERAGADPVTAIEQVVRHAPEAGADELHRWLDGLVEAGADRALSEWSSEHELAMGAARAKSHAGPAADVRVVRAPEDVLELGREVYFDQSFGCVRCHAADGRGVEGFPALDRSPYVVGDPRRAAAIVIHGLTGPIEVGDEFNSTMAPLGASMSDEQLAAVLTFARQSWGNYASPVSPETVTRSRGRIPDQGGLLTVATLDAWLPLSEGRLFSDQADALAPGGVADARSSKGGMLGGVPVLLVLVAPAVLLGVLMLLAILVWSRKSSP